MIGIRDGDKIAWLEADTLVMAILAVIPPREATKVIQLALQAAQRVQHPLLEVGRIILPGDGSGPGG
jgi:hypothetical protein